MSEAQELWGKELRIGDAEGLICAVRTGQEAKAYQEKLLETASVPDVDSVPNAPSMPGMPVHPRTAGPVMMGVTTILTCVLCPVSRPVLWLWHQR